MLPSPDKHALIARLRQDILRMEGFKPVPGLVKEKCGLGVIGQAFPNGVFPLGHVHEFIAGKPELSAASAGFIAALLSVTQKEKDTCVWVGCSGSIFPPALTAFGLIPDRVIFIDPQREADRLWVLEETLKCGQLGAVIAELRTLSFAQSRRLQLAVERSKVTGFIIRTDTRRVSTTACVSRWMISPVPGETADGLPGTGFPRWNVELQRVRNGTPGSWTMDWSGGTFTEIPREQETIVMNRQRQTG